MLTNGNKNKIKPNVAVSMIAFLKKHAVDLLFLKKREVSHRLTQVFIAQILTVNASVCVCCFVSA